MTGRVLVTPYSPKRTFIIIVPLCTHSACGIEYRQNLDLSFSEPCLSRIDILYTCSTMSLEQRETVSEADVLQRL